MLGSNVRHEPEQQQLGEAGDQLPAGHRHMRDTQRAAAVSTAATAAAATRGQLCAAGCEQGGGMAQPAAGDRVCLIVQLLQRKRAANKGKA